MANHPDHAVTTTDPGANLLFAAAGLLTLLVVLLRPAGEILAVFNGAAHVGGEGLTFTNPGAAWSPPLNNGTLWATTTLLAAAVAGPLLVLWLRLKHRTRSPSDVAWATTPELTRSGLVPRKSDTTGRIVVGTHRRRPVAVPRTHSLLVFGPSGSWKTSAVGVPALLAWDGPAVVGSVKDDILRATLETRAMRGPVLVYDPLDRLASPDRCGWDPLKHCDTYKGASELAANLMSLSDFGKVSNGDFWRASAESLLAPLLFAARIGNLGVADIRRWLNDTDWDQAKALLQRAHHPEVVSQLVGATDGTNPETYLSYVASARVGLKAYETPEAAASTRIAPQIDPDELLDGTVTLYLVGDEDDQDLLRPLFVGVIDEIMRHAARRTNQGTTAAKPLLLLLDEVANAAPLPKLPSYASTARGRGVQLISMFQDWGQVVDRYGRDRAATLNSNHHGKLLLPGATEMSYLEDFSKLLGQRRIITRSRNIAGRLSANESETFVPLATPDELRRLQPGTGVFVHGTTRPARIQLRPYWKHPQPTPVPDSRTSETATDGLIR